MIPKYYIPTETQIILNELRESFPAIALAMETAIQIAYLDGQADGISEYARRVKAELETEHHWTRGHTN